MCEKGDMTRPLPSSLFADFCGKYQSLHGTSDIWVAYSGGVDSRVLLELAYQYVNTHPDHTLQAIHINHGLYANAANWAKHCKDVCAELQIPLHIVAVKLNLSSGQSVEAEARQARRNAWKELLPENATLLLAHHAQDQVETILYRLCRGAGPTGLSGMVEAQHFGRGLLLRPLLQVRKNVIDEYASYNKLAWVEDDSNANVKFDRNFIRHEIIPRLSERWPCVTENVLRSAVLCQETVNFMHNECQHILPSVQGSQVNTLSIKKLLALSNEMYSFVIREWLANNDCQMPSRRQVQRLKDEVMLAKHSATPTLNFTQYQIRRYRDNLYLIKHHENQDKSWQYKQNEIVKYDIKLNTMHIINLPNGKILSINKTVGEGILLPNEVNEITIYIGSHSKKSKKIFQQHAIPPWQRRAFPLLFVRDKLIAIVGLWVRNGFLVTADKIGLVIKMG